MNPVAGLLFFCQNDVHRQRHGKKQIHKPSMMPRLKSWSQRASYLRRFSSRIGLQGKLLLCFFLLILTCAGTNCWMFARQSGQQLNDIMAAQARQLCSGLALSSEENIDHGRWGELTRTGQDLIKSRDILFVGFMNENFETRALASRDLDFRLPDLGIDGSNMAGLGQVRAKTRRCSVITSKSSLRFQDPDPQSAAADYAAGGCGSRRRIQARTHATDASTSWWAASAASLYC